MKKIRILLVIIGTLGIVITFFSVCKAEVSPFKPDWYIGDTWKMEFTRRSTDEFYAAAKFIGGPKYGDFFEPSIYIFAVTGKKEIKGEECFEVEMYKQYPDEDKLILRLYYTINTLKIKLAEEISEKGIGFPYYPDFKNGLALKPFPIISPVHLTWPDFIQLDPANSPQVFGRILQEVTVQGDELTIRWRLGYNEEDGTYGPTWQQKWKKGDPWWYEMKTTSKEGQVISKARCLFVPDTEPPDISLALIPIKVEEGEGRFKVSFSVSDDYDYSPTVAAVVETPTMIDPKVEMKIDKEIKYEFDLEDNEIEIKGWHPEEDWEKLRDLGGIEVTDGQLLEIESKEEGFEAKFEHDILKIEAPAVVLRVTATDFSGNQSTASAVPTFTPEEEDEGEED